MLVLRLSSLPRVRCVTVLWHLVRIFGCDRVRLRKPAGADGMRSSLYALARGFPGAGPATQDLVEVCSVLLKWTSSGPGRDLSKPAMPGCFPTPPTVLVKHLCAFLEALSRDAKPIWAKQYADLRSHLLQLRAKGNQPERRRPKKSKAAQTHLAFAQEWLRSPAWQKQRDRSRRAGLVLLVLVVLVLSAFVRRGADLPAPAAAP